MSKLAGIFDPGCGSIPLLGRIQRRLAQSAAGAFGVGLAPGLLIAQAGNPFAPESVDQRQPFTSAIGNVITWDGRLDNREDLLARWKDRLGRAPSDAALALAAYEAGGSEALRHLIGDWSLAIWDASNGSVLLASDHAGVRPLYYHHAAGRLVWSSTLADLVAWTGAGDVDDEYVAEFFMRGMAARRTPYAGIHAVPPGSAVRLSEHRFTVDKFWTLIPGRLTRYKDECEYVEQLRLLFEESVRVRLRAAGPVYAELSGGLDSSSIVCMARELVDQRRVQAQRIVGVTYRHSGSIDERFYRTVEEVCNLDSVRLETTEYPFAAADSPGSATPMWWAARHAELSRRLQAAGSVVLLTGQTGDLVMGNWLDDAGQVADLIRDGRLSRAAMDALSWSQTLSVPVYLILWRALRLNLPFISPAEDGGSANFDPARDSEDSLLPDFRKRARMLVQAEADVASWADAPPGRRKHFRAMSEILESRILQAPEPLQPILYTHPYTHRPLIEFMFAIPGSVVCGPGEPRRLMRRAFQDLLPPAVLRRRSKAAFNTVFEASMRPLALELLRTLGGMRLAVRGYVSLASLEARLRRFLDGLECNEPQLRHIILLEFWLRHRESSGQAQFRQDHLAG